MRDRRNTNLSTSSNSSDSSVTVCPREVLNEKDCALALEEGTLLDSDIKEHRCRSPSRRHIFYRLLTVTCIAVLILLRFVNFPCPSLRLSTPHVPSAERIINHVDLPHRPDVLLYNDAAGSPRWTISIPANKTFPLPATQYQHICKSVDALRSAPSKPPRFRSFKLRRGKTAYYAHDPTFTNVHTAQAIGLLPSSNLPSTSTCESSLTFSLDTESASFGKSLLLLWLSYGLAKYEGRAFFIDDSRWPYGKYTSYFAPPPQPICRPPPPSQIVPCPHEAKHIVVSAATAKWTFGPSFDAYFAQRKQPSHPQQPTAYQLARTGYDALFKLVGDDEEYARIRAAELKSDTAPLVAIHIRRGDLHPLELEFSRDYLPLERYTTAARSLLRKLTSLSSSPTSNPSSDNTAIILASDDPNTITTPDLLTTASPSTVLRAQDRIQLATKAALDRTSPAEPIREPGSAYVKHVDENAGWDGGFYTRQFLSLGQKKQDTKHNAQHDSQHGSQHGLAVAGHGLDVHDVSEDTMRMRELIARSYLLDLAVLSHADGVVCAVSSAACRVLGVMLGDEAVGDGRWVNVDDGRGWSWDGRR